MPKLRSREIGICYESRGSGPPIVFAHESTGDYTNWQPQIDRFAKNFTCIAFNARGYPPSDVPESPDDYSQELFVADMLAVLDRLEVERAHIVGLSMGSMTSLNFALAHPDRALSVVLAGTGPGQSRAAVEEFNSQVRVLSDRLEASGWSAILDEYDAGLARRDLRWKNPPMHRLYCERLRNSDGVTAARILRRVVCHRPVLADMEDRLARLDVPVLIVTGDNDADCLPTSFFLHRVLPRCGLAVFPCTGHAVNLEEPELFNTVIEQFYQSIKDGHR